MMRQFLQLLDGFAADSWRAARCVLAMVRGEEPEDLELARRLTGRTVLPATAVRTLLWIAGRGSGKSKAVSALLAFLATAVTYPLSPGERCYGVIVSPTKTQSRVTFGYILGLLQSTPVLAALIQNVTQNEIMLSNGVSVIVQTPDHRTFRGRSCFCVIIEECAFLPTDESATPDTELIRAVMPSLGRVPGSILVLVSSPWARRGELYQRWRKHWGIDGDSTLVVHGATRDFNPSFDQAVIDEAYQEDAVSAATEFGAEWRSDAEALLTTAAIGACVVPGRLELPRLPGVTYTAGFDAAGGSGKDSMTGCVVHRDGNRIIVDAVRERRPPFSPDAAHGEFAAFFKLYGLSHAISDKFGSAYAVEAAGRAGMTLEQSARPKNELYLELVPLINSCRIDLLDHPRLLAQLGNLERRVARGGRESVDAPPGGHEDLANALAVAVAALSGEMNVWLQYAREFCDAERAADVAAGARDHALTRFQGDRPMLIPIRTIRPQQADVISDEEVTFAEAGDLQRFLDRVTGRAFDPSIAYGLIREPITDERLQLRVSVIRTSGAPMVPFTVIVGPVPQSVIALVDAMAPAPRSIEQRVEHVEQRLACLEARR